MDEIARLKNFSKHITIPVVGDPTKTLLFPLWRSNRGPIPGSWIFKKDEEYITALWDVAVGVVTTMFSMNTVDHVILVIDLTYREEREARHTPLYYVRKATKMSKNVTAVILKDKTEHYSVKKLCAKNGIERIIVVQNNVSIVNNLIETISDKIYENRKKESSKAISEILSNVTDISDDKK